MMKEKLALLAVVLALVVPPVVVAWYEEVGSRSSYPENARVIDLTGIGSGGTWTLDSVTNSNYWWKTFDRATLHLTLHDPVVLRLRSADVLHQFYVPALGLGPVTVKPGELQELSFTADKAGVFQYYCTFMCGECHFYMRGWIIVTPAGEAPPEPEPIYCPVCLPDFGPPPQDDPIALGGYLYLKYGCGTCHGPEGRGGVTNYNYLNETVPPHYNLASKIFLRSEEDAELFLDLIRQGEDLSNLEEDVDISGLHVVMARFNAAADLIVNGKNAAPLDPQGPEPPLQMPAWKYKLSQRQVECILGYFVHLFPWDEED